MKAYVGSFGDPASHLEALLDHGVEYPEAFSIVVDMWEMNSKQAKSLGKGDAIA